MKISRTDNHGREQLVGVCNKGEMFPHLGYYFGNTGYPANALVLEDAYVIFVPSQNIERLLTNFPAVSVIILKLWAKK
ncbi:Crp/Fnr family transcriptional regulator [Anaerobacillus sp. HL2]|nr:Crp/Fnr family transcriptional regulator [Anaerobacillus sp. HL2]